MAVSVRGIVFVGGTVACMARIYDEDDAAITQAKCNAITYSIYSINRATGTRTAIENHQDVSLTVANVVFDSNQTGTGWSEDSTGYNFRFVIDISSNAAFATVNTDYVVEVTIDHATANYQDIVVPFDITAI